MKFNQNSKEIFAAFQTRYAPLGTWRGRVLQILANGGVLLIQEGLVSFLRTISRRFYLYWSLRTTYQRWVRQNTALGETLSQQRNQAQSFPYRPMISILTPVYNPPPLVLRAMLESVVAQTYDHWELCLVDGSSNRAGVRETLSEFVQNDPRIHLQTLEKNLGISGNSNVALQMAEGEFIQILDHDDTLTPDALFEIVKSLNENPDADLLYFDEDKLSEDGRRRRGPIFKPDWSPEMLLSANYLSHCLIRRTLALETGMFNSKFDGAQDWDLALRVTERARHVVHIPKVLYNWRQVSGSTSIIPEAKTGVFDAQKGSVANHLMRKGLNQVRGSVIPPGYLRFQWPVAGVKISIVVTMPEEKGFVSRFVASLLQKTKYPDYEIILIGKTNIEAPDPRIHVVGAPHLHDPATKNLGAQHANGDLLLFLSSELEPLDADWLEELARWAERPEIGVVGAKLLNPNHTVQHAGLILDRSGYAHPVFYGAQEREFGAYGSVDWYRNYSAVSGDCMMVSRDLFEALGGFTEPYKDYSAVALCLRVVEQGFRNIYTPFARMQWMKKKSRRMVTPVQSLHGKYFERIKQQGDPCFNPNLSISNLMPASIDPS